MSAASEGQMAGCWEWVHRQGPSVTAGAGGWVRGCSRLRAMCMNSGGCGSSPCCRGGCLAQSIFPAGSVIPNQGRWHPLAGIAESQAKKSFSIACLLRLVCGDLHHTKHWVLERPFSWGNRCRDKSLA